MERDVIMRQVNQFALAIARALVARKSSNPELAAEIIEQTVQQHLGMDLDKIMAMPESELLDLLKVNGAVDTDFAVSLANLFETRGDIAADQDLPDSNLFYGTALEILYIVRKHPGELVPLDLSSRITELENVVHNAS